MRDKIKMFICLFNSKNINLIYKNNLLKLVFYLDQKTIFCVFGKKKSKYLCITQHETNLKCEEIK